MPDQSVNTSAAPGGSRKGGLFLILFFVVIALLGMGAGLYLLQDQQDIREDAATGPAFECPLQAGEGEILVQINARVLRSDQSQAKAMAGPFSANIPAGTYKVTLVSYDEHTLKPSQTQPAESYYLDLQANGQSVIQTNPISDLPDDQDSRIEDVNTNLEIGSDITQVFAKHVAYPSSSPNSIDAVCALFVPAEEPIVAQCMDVKVFDTEWNRLIVSDLANLESGDTIRFSVSGSTTKGIIEKARFSVNGVQLPETTEKRPGTEEFYSEYTIPEGILQFSIKAEVHHSTLGWY